MIGGASFFFYGGFDFLMQQTIVLGQERLTDTVNKM